MIPLPLDELRGLGRLEGEAAEVTGVEIDSRRVSSGDLFVAIRGGIAYLDEARARGAAATLVPDDEFAAAAVRGRTAVSRQRIPGFMNACPATSRGPRPTTAFWS